MTLNEEWLLVPDGPVWVFQKLLIYWDFHAQPSLGFTENGLKKRKYPVSGSCVDEKCLVDVRGQRRMDRLVRDDRKATVTQITTRYKPRYAEYHLWTHNTSNPEADVLQQQKTTPVPLLSDKNRTRRIQFTQTHYNRTIEDWKSVAWCDDSGFLQHSDDGVRIWRKDHESMDSSCLVSMVQGWWWWCWMVWGIFSWHTLGP